MSEIQLELFEKSKFYATDFEEDAVHFKQVTGVKLFVDGLMTCATGRTQIDILKVDRELMREHSEYNVSGCCAKCSLMEFLEKKFGEDIKFIVHKWTIIPEEDEQVDV